ncbi:MAG: methionine adenosyltransferase [Clostridia bacterium]
MGELASRKLFTSESVTEGHPDKVADQISDAVLDSLLEQDPESRVAVETLVSTGLALVAGQVSSRGYTDIPGVVRNVVRRIGYTDPAMGIDCDTMAVLTTIDEQSPDIRMGVETAVESRAGETDALSRLGAGDQGMVFGFACQETPELMPLPISLANRLARTLASVRTSGRLPFVWPDGKTQVTVAYEGGVPAAVTAVVVSTQHSPSIEMRELEEAVRAEVIQPALGDWWNNQVRVLVNPTGRFVIGGPHGDTGLTGRKIIVDTYGGMARHGGGAYSGKDPTKVDRSASYAARWVAKNLVAAGLASRAEVQVAYAIGVAHPVSISVDSFGTGTMPDSALATLIERVFDLRPLAIIRTLDLARPIYLPTAAYGHFGRTDLELPWEALDRVDMLLREARLLV